MPDDALPEEWEILRGWLPADLDTLARKHSFFQRARGLTDGERWLRLILMHVAGGLSLEQTALRARELGLAQISAVALFERVLQKQANRVSSLADPDRDTLKQIAAADILLATQREPELQRSF